MPYLADYSYVPYEALAADPNTLSYKAQIKAYWEGQIASLYPAYTTTMNNQLWTYLNSVTAAEDSYKAAMNSLDAVTTLRYLWQKYFGYLVLYVLYAQCMEFPSDANLPAVPGMMIPLNTGEALKAGDDLRSFATPWRYTWPGDGMTNQPWFTLSAGTVSLRNSSLGIPEITAMINALNARYPFYSTRYSNTDSYKIGADGPSGLTSITDATWYPPPVDYLKFYGNGNATIGFVDRMKLEFMNGNNWTIENYERYRAGTAIMTYLAAGGNITMLQSPKEWMLANGGRDLMDYFGWQDLAAAVLFELPEDPDDITPPDPGLGAGFGVRFGEEFA